MVYACATLNPRRSGRAALVVQAAHTPAWGNPLALVGFLLSLVFPVGVVLLQLGGGIYQVVDAFTPPAYRVGQALLIAGMPATLLAIVMGHIALRWAKRRSYQRPLRGIAITGLVLGYGALVAYIGWFALGFWVATHLHLNFPY